jgi:hypothetical protein
MASVSSACESSVAELTLPPEQVTNNGADARRIVASSPPQVLGGESAMSNRPDTHESSARASVYVFSVSSVLVALGFIGQVSEVGDVFNAFALTVLPTLYLLGAVTFIRLVECGAEDFRYGMAINRIRNYYQQVAGDRANLFLLSGHDDATGVFANMGLPLEGRSPVFAFSSAATAIASVVAWVRYADRLLDASAGESVPLFPSPSAGAESAPQPRPGEASV